MKEATMKASKVNFSRPRPVRCFGRIATSSPPTNNFFVFMTYSFFINPNVRASLFPGSPSKNKKKSEAQPPTKHPKCQDMFQLEHEPLANFIPLILNPGVIFWRHFRVDGMMKNGRR